MKTFTCTALLGVLLATIILGDVDGFPSMRGDPDATADDGELMHYNTKGTRTISKETQSRNLATLSGFFSWRTSSSSTISSTSTSGSLTDAVTFSAIADANREQVPDVKPKYNPMDDAKCFNENYYPLTMTDARRNELYNDYVKIFRWGLLNPSQSSLFAQSSGVSSNRFPGMCLRMAFHDNTIDPNASLSAQAYIKANFRNGKWIGPRTLQTSGGDASCLVCESERLHPNNNYDQTASRVLYAFQSSDSYPNGPGITRSNGSAVSLKQKYDMSYADALQNCALAAMTFLTEKSSSANGLGSQSQFVQSDAVKSMQFGRLDACHVSSDPFQLYQERLVVSQSRIPLCGRSDLLPGVTLQALQVSDWFVQRGMAVGAWLSLFGTHSLLDNFMSSTMLRNVGIKDNDYFEDFVGCPHLRLKAPVLDPEDGGCVWDAKCSSGNVRADKQWRLVQSDCATGINILNDFTIGNPANFDYRKQQVQRLKEQMNVYIQNVGAWVPDIVCALEHLGGRDDVNCVGPNAVDMTKSNSMFGSTFAGDVPTIRRRLQVGDDGYNATKEAEEDNLTLLSQDIEQPEELIMSPAQSTMGTYTSKAKYVGYDSISISAAGDGTLISANTKNAMWTSKAGIRWSYVPGDVSQVAAVGKNMFFSIGMDEAVYRWNGSWWKRLLHGARAIAASDDGDVAIIKSMPGTIWVKQGGFYKDDERWLWVTNVTHAQDVALVGGGTLYYVTQDGSVFRTSGGDYTDPGVKVGSGAVKISASRDGTVLVISADGKLLQKKTDSDNDQDWYVFEGITTAVDVAVVDKNTRFIRDAQDNIYRVDTVGLKEPGSTETAE